MSDDIKEGWGFPGNSRKAHYFVDYMSLCRKWLFKGSLEVDTGKTSPDDCAICRKKLEAKDVRK